MEGEQNGSAAEAVPILGDSDGPITVEQTVITKTTYCDAQGNVREVITAEAKQTELVPIVSVPVTVVPCDPTPTDKAQQKAREERAKRDLLKDAQWYHTTRLCLNALLFFIGFCIAIANGYTAIAFLNLYVSISNAMAVLVSHNWTTYKKDDSLVIGAVCLYWIPLFCAVAASVSVLVATITYKGEAEECNRFHCRSKSVPVGFVFGAVGLFIVSALLLMVVLSFALVDYSDFKFTIVGCGYGSYSTSGDSFYASLWDTCGFLIFEPMSKLWLFGWLLAAGDWIGSLVLLCYSVPAALD